jgi:tetratricopeptide (TPR) repeat protein
MHRSAIGFMEPILQDAGARIERDTDAELVAQGLPGTILLIDGLLETSPENNALHLLQARTVTGYALGFVEDENPEHASKLYLRAREHALDVLRRGDKAFARALGGSLEQFQEAVRNLDDKQLEAIFWTANAWGAWINLNLDDTSALADLPRVEALMQRALEIDPTYYHAGPHLFMAVYYSSRSKILGGDPERAQRHFDEVFRITEDHYLLAHVFYAQYFARQAWDPDLFTRTLQRVLAAPDDLDPDSGLSNAIAKAKAKRMLPMVDEWF